VRTCCSDPQDRRLNRWHSLHCFRWEQWEACLQLVHTPPRPQPQALAARLRLDVLALCETHLTNQEQLVMWRRTVDDPATSRYSWHGRPAVKLSAATRGRGSGGVGLLVRRDWSEHCTVMPDCEHPHLLFVRLNLPGAPFRLFIGVVYAPPGNSGSSSALWRSLLSELSSRVAEYQALGMVLVLGDLNARIGVLSHGRPPCCSARRGQTRR